MVIGVYVCNTISSDDCFERSTTAKENNVVEILKVIQCFQNKGTKNMESGSYTTRMRRSRTQFFFYQKFQT